MNILGELICRWVDRDDDEAIYSPDREVGRPEQKLDDERTGETGKDDGKDDLSKCSMNNVNCPVGAIPGSKPFCCLKPLSKDEALSKAALLRSLNLTTRISCSVVTTYLRKIALSVCTATLDSSN